MKLERAGRLFNYNQAKLSLGPYIYEYESARKVYWKQHV